MPPKTKLEFFLNTQTTETLLNSALERMKKEKHASSFSILRSNISLMEHTSVTGQNCIGPNGTQTGTEVEFVINDQTEKTLVCHHCYKSGLVEQK